MKLTIDRKPLLNTLKSLKSLASKGKDPRFVDVVVLKAEEHGLIVCAGTGAEFVSAAIEAVVEKEGSCTLTFKLYDLLKAVRDDVIQLTSNENTLKVTSESGLKSNLTLTDKFIPVDELQQILAVGIEAHIQIYTEALINLAELSSVFTPTAATIRWMEVSKDDQGVYGYIRGSEYGTLERLPIEGEGDNYNFVLRPDHLTPILAFCGETVRISAIKDSSGIYMLTDPDNPDWWAAVRKVSKK
jgi:DNA polymerase III sliding clamp (beta) subunit (PCNA family)